MMVYTGAYRTVSLFFSFSLNICNDTQVTKRIDYDTKHGVEKQEVLDFLESVKRDKSFNELRKANDFGYRLDTLEAGFLNKDSKANHSLSFIDF